MNWSTNESADQSAGWLNNQPTNPLVDQPVSWPINWLVKQSTNRLTGWSTSQPTNQLVGQPVSWRINWSVNQSTNRSTGRSFIWSTKYAKHRLERKRPPSLKCLYKETKMLWSIYLVLSFKPFFQTFQPNTQMRRIPLSALFHTISFFNHSLNKMSLQPVPVSEISHFP